jgi:thioredoxin 1
MNEITKSSDFETVVRQGTVLVDFYSKGCAPCRALSMVMDKMGQFFDGAGVKIFKADVENCFEIAKSMSISAVPSVHLFKDGVKIGSFIGFRSQSQIVSFIEEYVGVEATHQS